MNFYSHAWVAAKRDPQPDFVLGAMLPDLVAMSGNVGFEPVGAVIQDGIDFHHASDAAFHGLEGFRADCRAGVIMLREAGLRTGPARAAAHVGVELLLDAALVGDAAADAGYRRALLEGPRSMTADPALEALTSRLAHHGPPHWLSTDDGVARALARTLSRRPRLALSSPERAALPHWLALARPAVMDQAEAWVRAVDREVGPRAKG